VAKELATKEAVANHGGEVLWSQRGYIRLNIDMRQCSPHTVRTGKAVWSQAYWDHGVAAEVAAWSPLPE
jgi:hypothetical protein